MANNTDSGWIEQQAYLEKAYTGEQVRAALIENLVMLKASHDIRVKKLKERDHFIEDGQDPINPGDADLNDGGGEPNG